MKFDSLIIMNRKHLSESQPQIKVKATVQISINNRILLNELNFQLKKKKNIERVICELYLGTGSFPVMS